MTRAKFHELADNAASITYTPEPEYEPHRRLTRFFRANPDGGYVWEHDGRGNSKQVCRFLHYSGITLQWFPSEGPLVELLRSEYRKMRDLERRDMKRMGA